MELNIIGNGFDLYHGLPTSYKYYASYLIAHNPESYEQMGEIFNFKTQEYFRTYPDFEGTYIIDEIFWNDFENCLGEADPAYFMESIPDDLGLENPDPVNIIVDKDKYSELLKRTFDEWLTNTIENDENYQAVKDSLVNDGGKNKFGFKADDLFVTFNYTHILEKVYNIEEERILHIHGECTEDGTLIVGHGNDKIIYQVDQEIAQLRREFELSYDQPRLNKINEWEAYRRFLKSLRKDVNIGQAALRRFLDSYRDASNGIKRINVYGSSLGDIDLPYFELIESRYPDAYWNFSYNNDGDKKRIQQATQKLELRNDHFSSFPMDNQKSKDVMSTIIRMRGIPSYFI